MSTEPLSPLEELRKENEEKVRARSELPGSEGAMYRLAMKMDSMTVADWIVEEVKRGTTNIERAEALSSYIANIIAPYILTFGRDARTVAQLILIDAMESVVAMTSGEYQADAVAIDVATGHQVSGTAYGFAQGEPLP